MHGLGQGMHFMPLFALNHSTVTPPCPPAQIVMTAIVLANTILMTPKRPDAGAILGVGRVLFVWDRENGNPEGWTRLE